MKKTLFLAIALAFATTNSAVAKLSDSERKRFDEKGVNKAKEKLEYYNNALKPCNAEKTNRARFNCKTRVKTGFNESEIASAKKFLIKHGFTEKQIDNLGR